MKIIKILIRIFKKVFKYSNYKTNSYSQEGEDLIIDRFFENQSTGFFIDIGAHHPRRFSNTYLLYQKGWQGINIDPMPGVMKLFNKERPKDINLEIGISREKNILKYYIFNEKALNTFSESEAIIKSKINPTKYFIVNTININTYPLEKILDKYIDSSKKIDLMSIDVEGLDLDVLKSNDWNKHRPKIILIEELRTNIKALFKDSEINSFLEMQNYSLHFRTYNTSFYIDTLVF